MMSNDNGDILNVDEWNVWQLMGKGDSEMPGWPSNRICL